MKLISTRVLEEVGDWDVFENIIETAAVQSNPFSPKYAHDFRFSFKSDGFVYFLFSRKLNSHYHKNFTFISRMCEEDHNYYSYTELQLNCSANNEFSKVLVSRTSRSRCLLLLLVFIINQTSFCCLWSPRQLLLDQQAKLWLGV